jgi:uroporphyrin-III C-methyltransferase/precorrin-2 dehydrogenase/sirohydrochlorin ferrochelatase/uroporphyrin-III C-methyltransferase
MHKQGLVSLVGAGPGDPELLTLKALRLLQNADVILYDRLVSSDILAMIPSGIARIAVGKMPGHHCVPQDQINEIIISLARGGRHVVRLKGGDPYVFGRGGEEITALLAYGIRFEVVPGITAASGCSAYSGIPLTYRGISRRVQFITGHFKNDEMLDIDWHKVADPQSTLVIYMGLANIEEIAHSLIGAGLKPETPAAVVENATTEQQRRVTTCLGSLGQIIREHGITAPAMIIIGEVVAMADELDWFQKRLEQRPEEQANYETPVISG